MTDQARPGCLSVLYSVTGSSGLFAIFRMKLVNLYIEQVFWSYEQLSVLGKHKKMEFKENEEKVTFQSD